MRELYRCAQPGRAGRNYPWACSPFATVRGPRTLGPGVRRGAAAHRRRGDAPPRVPDRAALHASRELAGAPLLRAHRVGDLRRHSSVAWAAARSLLPGPLAFRGFVIYEPLQCPVAPHAFVRPCAATISCPCHSDASRLRSLAATVGRAMRRMTCCLRFLTTNARMRLKAPPTRGGFGLRASAR